MKVPALPFIVNGYNETIMLDPSLLISQGTNLIQYIIRVQDQGVLH